MQNPSPRFGPSTQPHAGQGLPSPENTSQAVRAALDLPLMASLMGVPLVRVSGREYSPKGDPSLHLNPSKGTYHDKSGKHGQGDFIRLLQSWHGLPTYDASGNMAREALGLPRWGEGRIERSPAERKAYGEAMARARSQRAAAQREQEAQEALDLAERAEWARDWFYTFPELPMGYAREDVPCPGFDYLERRGWTHETTGRHIDFSDVRIADRFNFASKGEPREDSPAVLFAIRNYETGEVQGFQAVGHTLDGHKATFPSGRPAKKTLGVAKGGAVHFFRHEYRGDTLGICEGVGDALAIAKRGFWAIMAGLSVVRLPVLDGVKHLWIFPDMDDGGQGLAGAEALATQWRDAGREVTIKTPPSGQDWGACV